MLSQPGVQETLPLSSGRLLSERPAEDTAQRAAGIRHVNAGHRVVRVIANAGEPNQIGRSGIRVRRFWSGRFGRDQRRNTPAHPLLCLFFCNHPVRPRHRQSPFFEPIGQGSSAEEVKHTKPGTGLQRRLEGSRVQNIANDGEARLPGVSDREVIEDYGVNRVVLGAHSIRDKWPAEQNQPDRQLPRTTHRLTRSASPRSAQSAAPGNW